MRRFVLLLMLCLLLTLSAAAQEATPPVEPPSATPAPTDIPTSTPEPPTVTPLPSEAATDLPSATATETATESSTATPSASPTETPAAEVPTAISATAGMTPMALPVEPVWEPVWVLPSEDRRQIRLALRGTWPTVVGTASGYALQVNQTALTQLGDQTADDIRLTLNVTLPQGGLALTLRQWEADGYRAVLRADGIWLGRNGLTVAEAPLSLGAGSHAVDFSIVGGWVRLRVDGQQALSWSDASPLARGFATLSAADAGSSAQVDRLTLWAPGTEPALSAFSAAFAPDDAAFYGSVLRPSEVLWQPSGLRYVVNSAAGPVESILPLLPDYTASDPSASPNGQTVVFGCVQRDPAVFVPVYGVCRQQAADTTGATLTRLEAQPQRACQPGDPYYPCSSVDFLFTSPVYSPDGSQVAYARLSTFEIGGLVNANDIMVVSLTTGQVQRFPVTIPNPEEAYVTTVRWAGSDVLFDVQNSGSLPQILRLNPVTGSLTTLVGASPNDFPGALDVIGTAGGPLLVYERVQRDPVTRQSTRTLAVRTLDGGTPLALLPVSADGVTVHNSAPVVAPATIGQPARLAYQSCAVQASGFCALNSQRTYLTTFDVSSGVFAPRIAFPATAGPFRKWDGALSVFPTPTPTPTMTPTPTQIPLADPETCPLYSTYSLGLNLGLSGNDVLPTYIGSAAIPSIREACLAMFRNLFLYIIFHEMGEVLPLSLNTAPTIHNSSDVSLFDIADLAGRHVQERNSIITSQEVSEFADAPQSDNMYYHTARVLINGITQYADFTSSQDPLRYFAVNFNSAMSEYAEVLCSDFPRLMFTPSISGGRTFSETCLYLPGWSDAFTGSIFDNAFDRVFQRDAVPQIERAIRDAAQRLSDLTQGGFGFRPANRIWANNEPRQFPFVFRTYLARVVNYEWGNLNNEYYILQPQIVDASGTRLAYDLPYCSAPNESLGQAYMRHLALTYYPIVFNNLPNFPIHNGQNERFFTRDDLSFGMSSSDGFSLFTHVLLAGFPTISENEILDEQQIAQLSWQTFRFTRPVLPNDVNFTLGYPIAYSFGTSLNSAEFLARDQNGSRIQPLTCP